MRTITPRTKKVCNTTILVFSIYLFTMLLLSSVVHDNPHLIFVDQASAELINPFDKSDMGGDLTNYSQVFKQFEGAVYIFSGLESKTHNLHLMASPGKASQIYRNYTIYIFSNQPCFYEVKIDGQVFKRGFSEWKASVKTSSPYSTTSVEVRLINQTNATLPTFAFEEVVLLDSPWDAMGEGEAPAVVEEWVRFTRGEFTQWVVVRIAIEILFAFLAIVVAMSYATMHADLQGIERVL